MIIRVKMLYLLYILVFLYVNIYLQKKLFEKIIGVKSIELLTYSTDNNHLCLKMMLIFTFI